MAPSAHMLPPWPIVVEISTAWRSGSPKRPICNCPHPSLPRFRTTPHVMPDTRLIAPAPSAQTMSPLLNNGSVNQNNGSVYHSDTSVRAAQSTRSSPPAFGTCAILLAQKPFPAPLPSAVQSPSDPAPRLVHGTFGPGPYFMNPFITPLPANRSPIARA